MKNYHQTELTDPEESEELKERRRERNRHDRNEVKRYLQRCLKSEDFEADEELEY